MSTPDAITRLTDVGTTDAYVGIVKGVLFARAPEARVVDLVHAAEAARRKKLFVSRADPVHVDAG